MFYCAGSTCSHHSTYSYSTTCPSVVWISYMSNTWDQLHSNCPQHDNKKRMAPSCVSSFSYDLMSPDWRANSSCRFICILILVKTHTTLGWKPDDRSLRGRKEEEGKREEVSYSKSSFLAPFFFFFPFGSLEAPAPSISAARASMSMPSSLALKTNQ